VAEDDFAITTRTGEDGTTTVALAGEVDLYRVPEVSWALRMANGGRILVDLREVTFLDSTALALLVREDRSLRHAGRELIVLVGERTPTTALTVTGVDRILRIERAGSDVDGGPS
jgi:anti-anti-sigma factor